MKTPRPLRSTIFCHLAELLSVEDPTWEMIAMVFLVEVSLMAPLQASSNAWLSHAYHGRGSWGGRWALVGTVEEQSSNQCGVGHGGSPQSLPPPSRLGLAPASLP